jgi:hypothetical protein
MIFASMLFDLSMLLIPMFIVVVDILFAHIWDATHSESKTKRMEAECVW